MTEPKKRPYSIDCSKGGFTEQHHAEISDINNVVRTYRSTGHLPNTGFEKSYGEMPQYDYTETMRIQAAAQSMWEEMPQDARSGFTNVAEFIETLATQPESPLSDQSPLTLDTEPPEVETTNHPEDRSSESPKEENS